MKKHNKMIALTLMLTVIISSLAASINAVSVSDLNKKIAAITKEKEETSQRIDNTKDKKADASNEKQQIDNDINYTTQKINATQSKINSLEQSVNSKRTKLEEAQKKLDEQNAIYVQRMRANYKKGSVSALEVLFESGSFTEFLTRLDNAQRIAEYDKELIADMNAEKDKINQALLEIEENKHETEQAKDQLASQKSTLNTKLDQTESYINNLDSNLDKLKSEYARYEKEEQKAQAQIEQLLAKSDGNYVGGEFLWPLPGHTYISSPYGYRTHPITGVYKLHTGTDLSAPRGTKIVAANSGKVVKATYSYAYGNYIIVDHGGGKATLYAHCSKLLVSQGDRVTKGQKIAEVGATGYATGNHLHFEVRLNGKTTNPMKYFGR